MDFLGGSLGYVFGLVILWQPFLFTYWVALLLSTAFLSRWPIELHSGFGVRFGPSSTEQRWL